MSAIATLRTAVGVVLGAAEWRALGALNAVEEAATGLITVVTEAVKTTAVQAVGIVVGLTRTILTSAFDIAGSVADAVLGELPDDEEGS